MYIGVVLRTCGCAGIGLRLDSDTFINSFLTPVQVNMRRGRRSLSRAMKSLSSSRSSTSICPPSSLTVASQSTFRFTPVQNVHLVQNSAKRHGILILTS